MALDPQDTEGLEDETVAAWSVAEDVMIGVMAAAAMRAARKPGVPVRLAAQQEWARTVNPRVTATASGLVTDTPAMVERATEQAAIRGAEAAAQEATTVRPAAPRHRATLPGSAAPAAARHRLSPGAPGTPPAPRTPGPDTAPVTPRPRTMTLPRTRPRVPGNTTPPPVRPGRAAAEATGRALDKAARQVPRSAKSAWDRIINDAVNRTVAGELTIEQAMQQAMDQAAKEGIGFYRDSAGRKWGLDTYSEMAIRTGTNQALRDAHAAELLAQGIDLVIVSSHANPAPQCAPYEQKVLSLTGEHPNGRQTIDGQSVTVTASIAEAEANGLHHPNCRHTHTAYLPGFTDPLPVQPDPDHEGYKATQQQRYFEREIRRSARMEAAATTPEARAKAAARRRNYEAKLSAHRRQWDLPRRRHREQLRGPSGGAAAAGRRRTPTPNPTPVAGARRGSSGGGTPPVPPTTTPRPLMSGGGDDPRRILANELEAADLTIPIDHIIRGRIGPRAVGGAHDPARRTETVHAIRNGESQLRPAGKTYFPPLAGGTVALERWLSAPDGPVVAALREPDHVNHAAAGLWVVNKRTTTPDGDEIILEVVAGATKRSNPASFRVTSAYPIRGDRVTWMDPDGNLYYIDIEGRVTPYE
ncbi:hypothetical protein PQI66_09845 [Corynebacterium sp. USCH3]|uniref:phage minor capsid protein n=1 Tax=Corynebacterium sp. USCH3 TaxID=3024840 RepID=UPI00309CC601